MQPSVHKRALRSNPFAHNTTTSSLILITRATGMVHEVQHWDSDSEWADDEEKDELDQEPLMVIQDRVRPAELRDMLVKDVCRMFPLLQSPNTLKS